MNQLLNTVGKKNPWTVFLLPYNSACSNNLLKKKIIPSDALERMSPGLCLSPCYRAQYHIRDLLSDMGNWEKWGCFLSLNWSLHEESLPSTSVLGLGWFLGIRAVYEQLLHWIHIKAKMNLVRYSVLPSLARASSLYQTQSHSRVLMLVKFSAPKNGNYHLP